MKPLRPKWKLFAIKLRSSKLPYPAPTQHWLLLPRQGLMQAAQSCDQEMPPPSRWTQFSKIFQTLTLQCMRKITQRIYSMLTSPGPCTSERRHPPQLQRRTGIAKVTFGLWWGSPQGGPLFLFRTTLKALSVWDHLSSHKYQVTLGSKRWVRCKEDPKTKAATQLASAWGGQALGTKVQKGEITEPPWVIFIDGVICQ